MKDYDQWIHISTIPGDEGNEEGLKFDWWFDDVQPTYIDFQLNFTTPLSVSQFSKEPDYLKLLLNLTDFKDEHGLSIANNTILEKFLPRQMAIGDQANAIQAAGSTATGVSASLVGSNFAVNLLLSASLQ